MADITVTHGHHSDQLQPSKDDDICGEISKAVIEIGSLQNQETATETAASQNDAGQLRGTQCKESRFCEIITSRINGRHGLAPMVETKPSMRRAQMIGKKWLKELVFSVFFTIRELVTYGNALFASVLFFLTIAHIIILAVDGKKTIADYVHLAFSMVYCGFLISLDLIIVICFHKCKLVRDACKCCKWCRGANEAVETDSQPLATPSNTHGGRHCTRCCKLCCNNKYVDLVRSLLIGVFVYLLTVSSMLKVILNIQSCSQNDTAILPYCHTDVLTGLNITEFVVTAIWNLFFYFLCSFVILRTICVINKLRKDGPVTKTAQSLHFRFIFHIIGQMVVQILMIVCIGAKMFYENREFSAYGTIRISPYLWYMIVGGFLIPFAGVFTFAISNFYYVQEYLIGFSVDLLHNKVITRIEDGEDLTPELTEKDARNTVDMLKNDFTEIHSVRIEDKCSHVLESPLLVALSVVYALFLLPFAICCVLEPDPVSGMTRLVVLNGSTTPWVVFFVVGVLLVILVNISGLLVAGVWIVIIITIIILIILLILLSIPCVIVGCIVSCMFCDKCK